MKSYIILWVSTFVLATTLHTSAVAGRFPSHMQEVIGWTTNGPYGGSVVNVAVDPVNPLVVYVAAQQTGVFGTQDGGQSWSLLLQDPGWMAAGTECLVTHPGLPGVVFFAGSQELYRSDDFGQSWSVLRNDGQPIQGRVIALDPANPNHIFVGLWAGQVLRSQDGGEHWSLRPVGMPEDTPVDDLALDPAPIPILYAASREGGGVYRSSTAGESWELTPGQPVSDDTWSLAVSPHDHRLYQGGWNGPLSYSPDQGQSWYTLTVGSAPQQHNWVTLQFHPTQTQTVYVGDIGGLWRSANLGLNWEPTSHGAGWDLAIHPVHTNTLYAVGSGVLASVDGGVTWSARNHGITAIAPRAIAVAQNDPTRLVVGAGYSSGFYSFDSGQSWRETDVSVYHAVAFDPISPTVAYAASGNKVYRSENGGAAWTLAGELSLDALPAYIDGIDIRAIAIHPVTPTLIYAGVGFDGGGAPVLQEGGLYRSHNAGASWERVTVSLPISRVNTISIAPTTPYTLYLATGRIEHHLEQGNGIFRSTDDGQTWTAVNAGLPDLNMRTVLINPHNPLELLSAPWLQSDYAGGLGVYRSSDGGVTWNAANTGLTALTVEDLAFDPVVDGIVYAATWEGLFLGANYGQTWQRWGDAIGQVPVLSVATAKLSEDHSLLYAGVVGGVAQNGQSKRRSMTEQGIVPASVYSRAIQWQRVYLPLTLTGQ